MKRYQLEEMYILHGISNYKLKNTDDLLKVHGVDFKVVEGFNELDDLNRNVYEKFIINFFNGLGVESRATLIPKGIYWVEDTDYLAKEDPLHDYYVKVKRIVMAMDRSGIKSVLHTYQNDEYQHLEVIENEVRNYLRFEYEHQGRKEWLHVTNSGEDWY